MTSTDAAPRATLRGAAEKSAELSSVDALPRWSESYSRRLLVSDAIVVAWSVLGAHIIWAANPGWKAKWNPEDPRWLGMSLAVWATWMVVLALAETRDHRVMGLGVQEYRRIINSTLAMFGTVALFAYAFKISAPRSYVLVLLPFGLALLLLSRWMWRKWLHGMQHIGEMLSTAVVVGGRGSIAALIENLDRHGASGYRVVGACVAGPVERNERIAGVPVVAGVDDVLDAIIDLHATCVIVTTSDATHAEMVRDLAWKLEHHNVELVLAPALTDVVGPRIHTRPIGGLPLIHVERPAYQGRQRVIKGVFDRLGAIALLLMGSPVMIGLAFAVRVTSPGPVLFKQERIGLNGRSFRMLKFRSMRLGADAELAGLLQAQGATHLPLFKVRNDPRLTRIGAFIRRTSLDELPQLLNVLKGDMSLVGPRPQVAAEVALYNNSAGRRLFVKPGMTGLWQVSGRSDLAWEDAVRLDLFYVENWTVAGDLSILLRTVRAVRTSSGAL